jgi:hypothetical protein
MRNLCAITACALGVLITGTVAELSTEEARAIAEHAAEKALTNVDVETYVIADHTMVEFSITGRPILKRSTLSLSPRHSR